MRKKNPNFNEDNKNNRSDDNRSSENRRSPRSNNNDRPRRGGSSSREDRPKRDSRPFNSNRRESGSSAGRSSFGNDRRTGSRDSRPDRNEKPFTHKRKDANSEGGSGSANAPDRRSSDSNTERRSFTPNRSESDSRPSRDSRPFNNERRESSDRKPFRPDRGESDARPKRESRPFNNERRESSDRKPFRPDRGESDARPKRESRPFSNDRRESSDRKPFRPDRGASDARPNRDSRPFDEKRKEQGDRKPFSRKSDDSASEDSSSDKKPFRLDRPDRASTFKKEHKPKTFKKKDYSKLRPSLKVEEEKEDDGLIRLNKYIANAGISSRRQADEYIKTGVVEVNGVTVTEMGYKVKADDDVRFDGERISPEKKTYVLLNKPKGFITTTNDERDRKTVMELVANATPSRVFPVGRLDRQTTGVLLFTNDGHMAKKLTHPSHGVKKIYHVTLDKELHGDDMEKIRNGIPMQEGVAKVDKISFIPNKPHNEIGVEIHIGWNRVVRRLFEKLGYKVAFLDRVEFAGLTKKTLKRGDYRILNQKEVNFLKMI